MKLLENRDYLDDIKYIAELDLPWNKLKNKAILVSGASGLIGSCLIDTIMLKNKKDNLKCRIYALCRDKNKSENRFSDYIDKGCFKLILHDINNPILTEIENIDYVFHFAGNTHPALYASDPINTILTNVIGTNNMLDFAVKHKAKRFAFASSVEIYGENRGDVEKFNEDYCGYINCNKLRSGYPEGKRCGEALCQAYSSQYGISTVILRIVRSYGPTMQFSDTRAISQFLINALNHEDIILKSNGEQLYSYLYVTDVVSGILTAMLSGKNGEAYNVSNENSDIKLKELAQIIAEMVGKKIIFQCASDDEMVGYSKVTKAVLNGDKLNRIGWSVRYNIRDGVERTLKILSN